MSSRYMTIDPVTEGQAWIKSKLTTNVPLSLTSSGIGDRIFDGIAPRGTPYPFISISHQGNGTVLRGNGGIVVWAEMLYMVTAWGESNNAWALNPINAAINGALDGQRGMNSTVRIVDIWLDSPYKEQEPIDNGEQAERLGGIFRLKVQPL